MDGQTEGWWGYMNTLLTHGLGVISINISNSLPIGKENKSPCSGLPRSGFTAADQQEVPRGLLKERYFLFTRVF